MEQATIPNLVARRKYPELAERADEYLKTEGWDALLRHMQFAGSDGKARDALVALLELEAVGGTDSDIFKEFQSLEGSTLHEVRLNGVFHAMEILRDQIQNKHTYFLDVEAMSLTPYAILVKDVIDARKRELTELDKNPSRIEVLGTYYGFSILMVEGSQPHNNTTTTQRYGWRYYRRRTWLDESITDAAAQAVKGLTGQFAEEVDMDKKYRTLGSSPIFKSRCTKKTANILADAVRLALYKVPGNRSTAARNLGRSGDSRVLPFLNHRFGLEQNRRVRISIANALGVVGHTSSIDIIKDQIDVSQRYISKELEATIGALGGIDAPQCKTTLTEILEKGGNTTKAAAIQALGKQDPAGLVKLLTPYLKHKSRPVVRAAVTALTDVGDAGKEALKEHVPIIIKRIGSDRPSRTAVEKLLQIPEVNQMRSVQEFFAKKIYKLRKEAERWKQRGTSTSYSYWYRRREQRALQRLREAVDTANRYMSPPFQVELLNSVEAAVKMYSMSEDIRTTLGHSKLVTAIEVKKSKYRFAKSASEQTYFG